MEGLENLTPELSKAYFLGTQVRERNINDLI